MAFPITCPSCGKGFQLATEIYERKVAGKVVSIKCKQCHAGIRVDATTPGELKVSAVSPAAAGADSGAAKHESIHDAEPQAAPKATVAAAAAAALRARQPTLLGMTAPSGPAKVPAVGRAAPPAPAPPPAPEALWAVDSGGTGDDRELTDEQMKREIEAGILVATTLVWREGQADWQELGSVAQLARYIPAPKGALAPRPRQASTPEVDAPRPKQSSGGEVEEEEATMIYARSSPNAAKFNLPDLPGEYEPPLPPPPPPAAGRPAAVPLPAAGKPPGALPKAAAPQLPVPPPATLPLGVPAPPPLPPSSPFGAPPAMSPFEAPAAPPPLAAAPAAPPAWPAPPGSVAASVAAALPAAPAPPAWPAPPGSVAASVAAAAPPAPRMPEAPIPWGAGAPPPAPSPAGVVGVNPFAVGATTTDLDFPKPKSKLPLVIGAVVAIAAVVGIVVATSGSSSAPGPVATPAAPPPTPAPNVTATPAETATATATQTSPQAPTGGGDPLAPPTATPQKTGGGFSDLFAAGMEKAEKSGTTQAPAHPFDQDEARRAVSAVLRTVAACKEPGSPLGQTSAAITFESSGKVSSVTIGAPFAGTSTGTCMVTAFKQVKVTPFAGLPGTVSQSVSLR